MNPLKRTTLSSASTPGDDTDSNLDLVIVAILSEAAQAAKIQIYLLGDLEFYVLNILLTKPYVYINFMPMSTT